MLYSLHLAGTINGLILASLVPTVPFVILVMTPYIEQIDPKLEAAARVFGASTFRVFRHVLVPLIATGRPCGRVPGPAANYRDVRINVSHRRLG